MSCLSCAPVSDCPNATQFAVRAPALSQINQTALWIRVLEKLTVPNLVKKSPHFMQPDCSSPFSQHPAVCPYSPSDTTNPIPSGSNTILPSIATSSKLFSP